METPQPHLGCYTLYCTVYQYNKAVKQTRKSQFMFHFNALKAVPNKNLLVTQHTFQSFCTTKSLLCYTEVIQVDKGDIKHQSVLSFLMHPIKQLHQQHGYPGTKPELPYNSQSPWVEVSHTIPTYLLNTGNYHTNSASSRWGAFSNNKFVITLRLF